MKNFVRMIFSSLLFVGSALALAQGGTGGEVSSLTLINADTDQPVGTLTDGMTIDFGALGTSNLSVVANTNPATVGSVRFALDDRENYQTESNAPYAIAGDEPGPDYTPWTPAVGEHTLTVTPYSEAGGNGEAGTALTVRFNVVDASTNAAEAQTEPAPTEPVTPEPVTPEPVTPEPVTPEPVTPAPPTPEPTTPDTTPAETTPTEPAPAEAAPTETTPSETTPESTTPTQTDTAQTDTAQTDTAQTDTAQPSTAQAATPAAPAVPAQVRRTRYQVLPVDESGVRGSVLVSDYGLGGSVVVILLSGTPVDGVHPAHFHQGDCGSGGEIVVPLENVNGRSGLSVTTTDAPYDDIVSGNYYLNIHLSPDDMGTIVACGEVGANAQ